MFNCVFFAALMSIVESAKITKLHVPPMVYRGTEAILECDFILDEKEDELVVKWYLNDAAVYQWISGGKCFMGLIFQKNFENWTK